MTKSAMQSIPFVVSGDNLEGCRRRESLIPSKESRLVWAERSPRILMPEEASQWVKIAIASTESQIILKSASISICGVIIDLSKASLAAFF